MPKASKESASRVEDMGVMEGRYEELGGYTVGFETFREDADGEPVLKGLPDDRCQAPHWGYVFSGKIVVDYGDREETIEGGQAYYIAPGHKLTFLEDSEALEFTPTAELEKTFEAARRNHAAGEQL